MVQHPRVLDRVGFFYTSDGNGTFVAIGNEGKPQMETQLSGPDGRRYDAVCRHPAVSNPAWWDVRWMLRSRAVAAVEPNGNREFARNEQALGPHSSLDKKPY